MSEDKRYLKPQMIITPQLAKELLKNNNEWNRHIQQERVKFYARQMKDGKWQYNGESIKIYVNGTLADGQHRLSACVLADTYFISDVWYDIPLDINLFDNGQMRSQAQTQVFANHTTFNFARVSTRIANFYYGVEEKITKTTKDEVDVFIDAFKKEIEFTTEQCENKKAAHDFGKNGIRSAAFMYAIVCALANGVSEDTLLDFIDRFATGLTTNETEYSALVLRNDLLTQKVSITRKHTNNSASPIMQAIYDFSTGTIRKVSYSRINAPKWNLKGAFDKRRNK